MWMLTKHVDRETLEKMEKNLQSPHKMKSLTNKLASGVLYILTGWRGVDENGNIRSRKSKEQKN